MTRSPGTRRFSQLRLLLAGLWFYAPAHLAVVVGVAIATAVVGGALIVGDSVRGSLREMTLARLGQVDAVVRGPRFFTETLARQMTTGSPVAGQGSRHTSPALLMTGSLEFKTEQTSRRAGGLNVYGLDAAGWQQIGGNADIAPTGNRAVLSEQAARALGVKAGGSVTLWIEIPASIPRDTLLGKRDENIVEVTLEVASVVSESSPVARFGLTPSQQFPSTVFIDLAFLQDRLDLAAVRPSRRDPQGRPARVNGVLVSAGQAEGGSAEVANLPARELTDQLQAAWRSQWTLDDVGLRVVANPERKVVSIESDQILLDAESFAAAERVAQQLGVAASTAYVYLANSLRNADQPTAFSMYSTVAGLDVLSLTEPFGPFEFLEGNVPTALGPDEAILNEFLATDLQVQVGDRVRMTYHQIGSHGELPEVEQVLRVAGIVAMTGPAIDRGLAPQVRGITDAASLADWEQPFPMDLDRVTQRDDDYWNQYRATPKLFVSLARGRELWPSRFGSATSLRLAVPAGKDSSEFAGEVRTKLLQQLYPTQLGWSFEAVRADGLQAAQGSQDFTGLFLGFSNFLIVAAAILVGLVFRLGIEQRVSQLGLLGAVGFTRGQLLRQLLWEGGLLAVIGATLGTLLGMGYARLMIYGLTTWWVGAIGTRDLHLYVSTGSLVAGWLTGVIVALVSIGWSVWQLRKTSLLAQLSGQVGLPSTQRLRRPWLWPAVTGGLAALLLTPALVGGLPQQTLAPGLSLPVFVFFVAGLLLLACGLTWQRAWLMQPGTGNWQETGVRRWLALAGRNAARNRSRSVLTTALIALATFLIVAVAAGRRDPTADRPERLSGNGGFTLVAESATPVVFDLNTPEGRTQLGLSADRATNPAQRALYEQVLASLQVTALRMKPGDDASCLNLFATRLPTLLGAPDSLIERGGFRFAAATAEPPWSVLKRRPEASPVVTTTTADSLVVPALGDLNTLMFSLKKGLGAEIPLPDRTALPARLQVAGMFDGAVLQGVLVVSEADLLRLYPELSGYRYFLIEVPLELAEPASELLETALAPYGFDAEPVAERLARFLAVQNTYLSTFQALGGLGLLLGTAGLAIVMLRNVYERRSELALLGAIGFTSTQVAWVVMAENGLLLGWGLATGTVSALLAMLPHLQTAGADTPWGQGALLLVCLFGTGMLASLVAVNRAVRLPVVATLRGE